MGSTGSKIAFLAFAAAAIVVVVTFHGPKPSEGGGDSDHHSRPVPATSDREISGASSEDAEIGGADNEAGDSSVSEAAGVETLPHDAPESPIFFFVTEGDFVQVAMYWVDQDERNQSSWRSHLESELSKEDNEENSRDLEQLAVSAVLRDTSYKYDPPISETELQPSCRNLVCKVEIPNRVKVTNDFTASRMVPGSILNTHDKVMFSHGFGHHLVWRQAATNTTTHYFLANGYETAD